MAQIPWRHLGLALHPDTNDLYLFSDGSLGIAVNNEAVGEHARQRLSTYRGEWAYDITVGTPWLQYVFVRPFAPGVANGVIKERLLSTPGVTGMTDFEFTVDYRSRGIYALGAHLTTDMDGDGVRIYI